MAETATIPAELQTLTLAEAENKLPAVVTEKFRKKGDLVNRADFTDEQHAAIAKAVEMFDITESSAILNFGAETQRRAGQYLREIVGDMQVHEAGVAGEVLTEISTGIDMMNVEKVRKQLESPYNWLGRIMVTVGLWTDYLKAFAASHQTVLDHFDRVETKANNQMADLSGESDKLDRLVNVSVTQIAELGVLIAVGEDILVKAQDDFVKMRDEVLAAEPVNPLKLQQAIDFLDSVRSMEVRLLRIQTAYVRLSTSAIPAIRRAQGSIKIEIQNISEAILYDLNDFYEIVIFLGSLEKTKQAQAARRDYDEKLSAMRESAVDVLNDVHESAAASRGSGLKRVQDLQKFNERMMTGARKVLAAEQQAAADRAEALNLLVQTRDEWVEDAASLAMEAVQ